LLRQKTAIGGGGADEERRGRATALLAVAAFQALCVAPVLAGKTEDRILELKVTEWKRCIFEAFVPRFQAGADKYAAIERAFSSCRDEEDAIRPFFRDPSDTTVVLLRAMFKREIVSKVP
jgi:hypothetical protein